MGVHGLWRLIGPSGQPVPLETLENKVLAVDVSIWLHQLVKGFQDSRGASPPHAHLLGIYHRICKLLYFRIKPVFVFDGGAPALKKMTIELRSQQKQKNLSEADRVHKNLLSALVKHSAISKVLSEKAKAAIAASTSPKKAKAPEDDLYVLPPSQLDSTVSTSSDEEDPRDLQPRFDLHSIDTQSQEFKSLPVEVRHEILTDLKDTRKQSSWGRINELPAESDDFATYQMKRLLKRQSVQSALEDVEKEMGGHSLSLAELEKLLSDQGVITNAKGSRIASDENTRFLLIKDLKQAIEEARRENLPTIEEEEEGADGARNKGDQEFQEDLMKAIALSLEEMPSTSRDGTEPSTSKVEENRSFLAGLEDQSFDDSESSEEEERRTRLTPAQRYMMEYSGLTSHAISKIIASKSGTKNVAKLEEKKVANGCKGESNVIKEAEMKSPPLEASVKEKSASDSSDSDDFLEVETLKDKSEAMEVVIRPDEEMEDDLFKDVFEVTKNSGATKVVSSSTEEEYQTNRQEEVETLKEVVIRPDEEMEDDLFKDVFEATNRQEEKIESNTSQTIEKMVEDYTKDSGKESSRLSTQQLEEMQENLRKEERELLSKRSTKERLAGNITDQMCQEAQELLELFGIPYIVAPMEAEAQCAFLELVNLTDGTITDDSDIWLFGGSTVYKNFFDQNKVVMQYKAANIQQHYKLSREQMILLAMLVGSDYTTGLTGVGPVTALEILAAFPPKENLVSGLAEFKSWCTKGKLPAPGRTSLRGKLKNVTFHKSFPNSQIADAYLEPTVEKSRENFSWGTPDVVGLVEFAMHKFGWTKTKSEEILNPILKRLEDARVQRSITDFFRYETRAQPSEADRKMSKRVKTAVGKIARGCTHDEEEEKKVSKKKAKAGDGEPKEKKKRVRKTSKPEDELKILKETEARSAKRVQEIAEEVQKEKGKMVHARTLHAAKEVIPQRQKDKADVLKNKLKAIETYRKSKQGPGYVKKRGKTKREPKEDASYLSEGSNSD